MPFTEQATKIVISRGGESSSTYNSEGDSSRQDSHEFSATEEEEWEEDDDDYYEEDDLHPSDSASASNDHPTLRTRPLRHAPRHHRPPRQQVQHPPVHAYAPNPPSSVEHPDEYAAPFGRGGYPHQGHESYYGARAPAQQSYPQSHHNGPYHGGYGVGNQMVPYAYASPNPFSPMTASNSSGMSYFGGEPHRGMYDMSPYHPNPNYYAGHHQSLPAYMQQFHVSAPPPAPTEAPGPSTTPAPREDPVKQALERELAAMKAQEEKAKAEEERKKLEAKIKEDAEVALRQRLEDMRRAQEEARQEIERAKAEAERAARARIEAERKAEEERNRQHAEAMARAEENARRKFEAEMKAAEERRAKEEEDRRRAEEAARIRLEAAIKAEAEAKAAAEKKAAEEIERFKQIQEDAKRTAEAEARAKLEKEQADAKAAAEAEAAAKKHEEATKKRIQEEAKAKFEEDAKKKKDKSPIKFTDAVGRKFSFPFYLCSTWEGMRDLINQAFQQLGDIGERVKAGQYDLLGPNGEIILPDVWSQVIEPDWSIKMTMWPVEKSPPLRHPSMHAFVDRHHHGLPPGVRLNGMRGVPPAGRRPGSGGIPGGVPVPPPLPGWPGPGGPRPPFNMPSSIDIVEANPTRKASKAKAKPGYSFLFGKPTKKKSHKK